MELLFLVQDVLIPFITILALALLIVAAMSYQRTGNPKILFISFAFALFFVKGLLLSVGLYLDWLYDPMSDPSSVYVLSLDLLLVLDMMILLLLYFSILKR